MSHRHLAIIVLALLLGGCSQSLQVAPQSPISPTFANLPTDTLAFPATQRIRGRSMTWTSLVRDSGLLRLSVSPPWYLKDSLPANVRIGDSLRIPLLFLPDTGATSGRAILFNGHDTTRLCVLQGIGVPFVLQMGDRFGWSADSAALTGDDSIISTDSIFYDAGPSVVSVSYSGVPDSRGVLGLRFSSRGNIELYGPDEDVRWIAIPVASRGSYSIVDTFTDNGFYHSWHDQGYDVRYMGDTLVRLDDREFLGIRYSIDARNTWINTSHGFHYYHDYDFCYLPDVRYFAWLRIGEYDNFIHPFSWGKHYTHLDLSQPK